MIKTDEIYDAGYAIPEYNISNTHDYWRFKNEHYKTPLHALVTHYRIGWQYGCAKIEDVRRRAIK